VGLAWIIYAVCTFYITGIFYFLKIFFYAGGPFTEYAVAAKWIEKVGKYYNEECRYKIIITSRV
jgi:hypothetical protein